MKINYRVIFLISLLCLTIGLNAQYRGGRANRRVTSDLRVGLNFSDMNVKGFNDYKKARIGYNFTWLVNYKFHRDLQLQSGFTVTKKGMKREEFSFSRDETTLIESYTDKQTIVNATYLQVPINIGWEHYFSNDFALNFNTGLYFALGVSGKNYQEGRSYNALTPSETTESYNTGRIRTFGKGKMKAFDYGLNASIGAIYDIYAITIGYEFGLNNISDNTKYKDVKNRNFYVALGFRF